MTLELSSKIESIIHKIHESSRDKEKQHSAIKELDLLLFEIIKNQPQIRFANIEDCELTRLREALSKDNSLISAFTNFRINLITKRHFPSQPNNANANYSNQILSNNFTTDAIPDNSEFNIKNYDIKNTFHLTFIQFIKNTPYLSHEHYELIERVLNLSWENLDLPTKLQYVCVIQSKFISAENTLISIKDLSTPCKFWDFIKMIAINFGRESRLWQIAHFYQMYGKHQESMDVLTSNGPTAEKWNHILKLIEIDLEGLLDLMVNHYNSYPEILNIDQFFNFYQSNLDKIAHIFIPFIDKGLLEFERTINTFLFSKSAQILWENLAFKGYDDTGTNCTKYKIELFNSIIQQLCRKSLFRFNNHFIKLESNEKSSKICYPYLIAQIQVISNSDIKFEQLRNEQFDQDRPFLSNHLPQIKNNLNNSIQLIKTGQNGSLNLRQYCELITLANQKNIINDSLQYANHLEIITQIPEHVQTDEDLKKLIQAAFAIHQMGYKFSWNEILPKDALRYAQSHFEIKEMLTWIKEWAQNDFDSLASLYIDQLLLASDQLRENDLNAILNHILLDTSNNDLIKKSFHKKFIEVLNHTEFTSSRIHLINKLLNKFWMHLDKEMQTLYCKTIADQYQFQESVKLPNDLSELIINNIDKNHPFFHLMTLLLDHDFENTFINSSLKIDSDDYKVVAYVLQNMLPYINRNLNQEGPLELVISHYPTVAKYFVRVEAIFHEDIINQFLLMPSLRNGPSKQFSSNHLPPFYEKLLHCYAKYDLINFFNNYASKIDTRYDISTKYLFLNAMLNALPTQKSTDQFLQTQLLQIKNSLYHMIMSAKSSIPNISLNIDQFTHLLIQSLYNGVIHPNSFEYPHIINAQYIHKIPSTNDLLPLLQTLTVFNRIGHQFQLSKFLGENINSQLTKLKSTNQTQLETFLVHHSNFYPEAASELYCNLFFTKYSRDHHFHPINKAIFELAISRLNNPYLFVNNYVEFLTTCFFPNDILSILKASLTNYTIQNVKATANALLNSPLFQNANNFYDKSELIAFINFLGY